MDGGGADAVAEFAEFALDALIAPGRVLPGHSFDQHGDGLVEGWATGSVGVGPLSEVWLRKEPPFSA